MASYPPPPFNDPRVQRRYLRDQARLQRLHLRSLRRSSIIGPVLVVGLGIVFLLVQLGKLPHFAVWVWFAHWWPLLLVFFGLIRLFEWFLDQRARSSSPSGYLPQRTLSGGVILLIGLLSAVGIFSSISRHHAEHLLGPNFQFNEDNLQEFFGDKHESTRTLTEACAPGTSVLINNAHGTVTIAGTSDDGQMHVSVNQQVFSRSDSEASRKAEKLTPQIDRSGDHLSLSIPSVEGARADLSIRVPSGTPVNATVNRGDIQVNTLKGAVAATANHGDIDLSGITGSIAAHINNGDSSFSAHRITGDVALEGRSMNLTLSDIVGSVSLSGEFFGTTHLERSEGPVHFHTSRTDLQFARLDGELELTQNADLTADRIVGPLVLNTRYRNINLDRVSGPLSITNRNGSVTVSVAQPLGNIMIENRNGELDLTLPKDAQFTIQAETSNADLTNDFGLAPTQDEDHPRLSGTVGKGGPSLVLSTSQADLSVRKGSIAPLPPLPPMPPRLTTLPAETQRSMREADKAMRDAQKQIKAAQDEVRRETRDLPSSGSDQHE